MRLYPEWAPLTVANFLNLVDRGYYDGLRWFRIVPDFVAQTGDYRQPTTTARDAGYTIPAEENPLEQRAGRDLDGAQLHRRHDPGPIRDSAGTQFYLTISPQLHLDRDFTVFGEIESGFRDARPADRDRPHDEGRAARRRLRRGSRRWTQRWRRAVTRLRAMTAGRNALPLA